MKGERSSQTGFQPVFLLTKNYLPQNQIQNLMAFTILPYHQTLCFQMSN